MSAQLWRDVRRLRAFLEQENENREASGFPKSSQYRREAKLAQDALVRVIDRLRRTFP